MNRDIISEGGGCLLSARMCRWLVTQLHWSGWLQNPLGCSRRPECGFCNLPKTPTSTPSVPTPHYQLFPVAAAERGAMLCRPLLYSLCQCVLALLWERSRPPHLFHCSGAQMPPPSLLRFHRDSLRGATFVVPRFWWNLTSTQARS